MAKKILLPLGRALIASSALILSPDDAALDADLVPDALADTIRPHASRQPDLPTAGVVTPSRSAWERRAWILSLEAHAGRARDFLILAREHDHDAYTVGEAAEAMEVTRQHLARLTVTWFSLAPKVVICLARIASVAAAVAASSASIASIARTHRFADPADMSRAFVRFLGVRPGAFRAARRRG